MATPSASSWTIVDAYARRGAVQISRSSFRMRFIFSAYTFARINMLTGSGSLHVPTTIGASISLKNAMARYIENVGATRYEVEFKGGSIYLIDKVKKSKVLVTNDGVAMPLPTKSIIKIFADSSFYSQHFKEWLVEYAEETAPEKKEEVVIKGEPGEGGIQLGQVEAAPRAVQVLTADNIPF